MPFFLLLAHCIWVYFGHGAAASVPELKLSVMPRIINGQDHSPGFGKWHVTIRSASGVHLCGGVLLDRKWVITSAHCKVADTDRAVVGMSDRRQRDYQALQVSQVFPHPRFNETSLDNNIALLKLLYPVYFTRKISLLRLPDPREQIRPGTRCYITGWGDTDLNEIKASDRLQQASVPILTKDECRRTWGGVISDAHICAGASGAAGWHGDAGIPLVCGDDGIFSLTGILSYMSEIHPTQKPMVFTRVSNYLPWIERVLTQK